MANSKGTSPCLSAIHQPDAILFIRSSVRADTRSSFRIQAFDSLQHNSRPAHVNIMRYRGTTVRAEGFYAIHSLRFMRGVQKARPAVNIEPRNISNLVGHLSWGRIQICDRIAYRHAIVA